MDSARVGLDFFELKVEPRPLVDKVGESEIGLIDETREQRISILRLALPDLQEILAVHRYKITVRNDDASHQQTVRIAW